MAALADPASPDAAPATFTLLHNETMTAGRYVPNINGTTKALMKPTFAFIPVVTARGAALNFGDNRLADLQARVVEGLTDLRRAEASGAPLSAPPLLPAGSSEGEWRAALGARSFPFEKPKCDGSGCVMKFIIVQLVPWIYMITMQSLLTHLGKEKDRSIKESLALSGMTQSAYFGSWGISKMVDAMPAAIVWTAGLFLFQCVKYQYFLPMLLVTYLYAAQLIAFGLWLQTQFRTSEGMFFASLMAIFVCSLAYYPVRLLGIDKGANEDAIALSFLVPSVPLCHYYWELIDAEGMKIPLDYNDGLVIRSIYMQLIATIFWLLLFAYCEQVMPQAHGPPLRKHCWCCRGGRGKKAAVFDDKAGAGAGAENSGIIVTNLVQEFAISAGELAEKAKKAKAKEEKKKKKDKEAGKEAVKGAKPPKPSKIMRAVDGLNMTFPKGEITVVRGCTRLYVVVRGCTWLLTRLYVASGKMAVAGRPISNPAFLSGLLTGAGAQRGG